MSGFCDQGSFFNVSGLLSFECGVCHHPKSDAVSRKKQQITVCMTGQHPINADRFSVFESIPTATKPIRRHDDVGPVIESLDDISGLSGDHCDAEVRLLLQTWSSSTRVALAYLSEETLPNPSPLNFPRIGITVLNLIGAKFVSFGSGTDLFESCCSKFALKSYVQLGSFASNFTGAWWRTIPIKSAARPIKFR
jgi:hypothetical protein